MDKSKTVQIENILNKDDGSLPFGYFEPSQEGRLTWNCGYDKDMKITSVFCFDFGTEKDRKIAYLSNMNEAIEARDCLIKNGWLKMKPPEITVKYDNGEEKPLNSKQKRYLAKQIKKMQKNDPFTEENK